ncbi:MAG: glycosyltransferase family 9 protein [Bacteroidetes bacterium]|nr:glycosyltransferase family 9 protein [Bacteroidota bacterium]
MDTMTDTTLYRADCRHFRGDIPCRPHKREGVHCADCPHYDPTDRNILIIKLGAIGDVIRTTPLFARLRKEFPSARIWWLTLTPDVLPAEVDIKLRFGTAAVLSLSAIHFDLLINLDKDREACALTDMLHADTKKGFTLRDGICGPIDADAEHKFLTGIFDDVNKANTKHYLHEIFEICGYDWQGEEYVLDVEERFDLAGVAERRNVAVDEQRPIIGLNTGCGGRWTSRLWPDTSWIGLAERLRDAGCQALFLGGEQEDEKNRALAAASGGLYLGHFSLREFIGLMDRCDVIVSAVTMAMHLAIGLKKPLILFNNIFNPHEFELYGRGEILEPSKPCTCFFQPTCRNEEYRCMEHLAVDHVFDAVTRALHDDDIQRPSAGGSSDPR